MLGGLSLILYAVWPREILVYRSVRDGHEIRSTESVASQAKVAYPREGLLVCDDDLFLKVRRVRHIPLFLAIIGRDEIVWTPREIAGVVEKRPDLKRYFSTDSNHAITLPWTDNWVPAGTRSP